MSNARQQPRVEALRQEWRERFSRAVADLVPPEPSEPEWEDELAGPPSEPEPNEAEVWAAEKERRAKEPAQEERWQKLMRERWPEGKKRRRWLPWKTGR